MGIALSSMLLLLNEKKKRTFSGAVLQIGRQDIYFNYETLENCAKHLEVSLSTLETISHRPNQWMPEVNTIDDQTFFKSLGFDVVQSIDTSDYEQADFIQDLNLPIPDSLRGLFDAVFDGGSLEHIFHVPNALANMHAMLKPGGRVIHHVPTHNYVDHGFYCFSPTLFWDYYEAAGYTDLSCYFVGHSIPFSHKEIPKVFPYMPGTLEAITVGGITKDKFQGCEMFITVFSATKTAASRGDVIPMQRRYQQWWAKAKANLPY